MCHLRSLYMEVVTVDCIKVGNNLGSILYDPLLEEIYSDDCYMNRNADWMLQFQEHTYQGLETQSTLNLKNVANVNDTYIIKNQPFFNHRLQVLEKMTSMLHLYIVPQNVLSNKLAILVENLPKY